MTPERSANGPPTARHGRRLPLVWLVPLAALLAAAWLGWRSWSESGPHIWITLSSAEGIEAGRTKIKHHDIELGTVDTVEPTPDLTHVVVKASMNVYAKAHLTKACRFWVVRPRLSAEGISGLGTLISGSYIEMDPGGGGEKLRHFTALEEPPVISADVPGTRYVLKAERLGSIIQGAPVSFRGIRVGQILGYELSDKDGTVIVQIFVKAPHDALVHDGTRFWNASGFSVDLGSSGLRLRTESLQAVLTGGISFDVPPGGDEGPVAKGGTTYDLYPDLESARDALYTRRVPFLLHFAGSVDGLAVGAPVRLRGIPIGNVTDVHLDYDEANGRQTVPVSIEIEPQRVRLPGSETEESDDEFKARAYDVFRRFVEGGLRAHLTSGSVITGQKLVSLDFMPDLPKASMIEGGPAPEIPTIGGSDLNDLMATAQGALLAVKSAVEGLDQLVRAPELKRSLASLDRSMASFEAITRDAQPQIGPLLADLRSASRSADQVLRQANATLAVAGEALSSDPSGGDISGTLSELHDAAASLHQLTDYLESHPEALFRGKK